MMNIDTNGRWIRSGSKIIVLDVGSSYAKSSVTSMRIEEEFEFEYEISFGDSFRKCMRTLGMPVPESLFGSYSQIVGTISTLVAVAKKLGEGVTIAELVGAGTLSENFMVLGALGVAAYAGACVGCLANATGEKLSGGITLSDAWDYLRS